MLTPRQQLAQMGVKLEEMEQQHVEPEAPRFQDVQAGPEFHRVQLLPRRPVPSPDDPESVDLAAFLTSRLAKVSQPYPGPLRPVQALALQEAWLARGLVAPIKVGGGKMLLSYLLPSVLRAKRPVLVTMAQMKPDTAAEFAKYRQHWHGPSPAEYPIISYELLATPGSGEDLDQDGKVVKKALLERLAPDLIVMDEAHRAADSGTTTAKRLKAYKRAHPECMFVVMTGTLFKTSIKDASHLMEWCLNENAPLPYDFLEREMWASYLDARKSTGPRAGAGALLSLLTPHELKRYTALSMYEDQRTIVRAAVSRRILETRGVIGTQDPPLDIPITIEATYPLKEDPAIEDALAVLKTTGTLPDGTELADMLQLHRHANDLGKGFWRKWDPPPPDEWRAARNAWAKWCRRAVKVNRKGIDSEARMKAAVKKGIFDDEGLLEAWEAAEKAERERTGFLEPPSVAVWVSDEIVDATRAWLAEYGGLVWVDAIGLGERLSKELSLPYYGAESRDANGRHIMHHPGGPAIASLNSCGTGKNLQKFWSDNLWLCMPGEQSLARTHRPGQTASVVRNWIYLGCAEHLKGLFAAKTTKAKFADEMTSSPQKLRYAETDMPTMAQLGMRGGMRWSLMD